MPGTLMPKSRAGRRVYALIVCACLLFIGRNLYRHYMEKALLDAIARHDLAGVRSLLRWGANPDDKLSLVVSYRFQDEEKDRPDKDAIACLLIRQSADRHPESEGFPFLTRACGNGSVDVVRCLLDRGADPRETNISGETPLSAAVNFSLNSPNDKSVSAQRLAAAQQIIAMLQAKGAQHTLWTAAKMGDVNAIKAVLGAGTPADAPEPRLSYHNTALVQSIDYGRLEAANLLLARGANPNLTAGAALPLSTAISKGDAEMVRLLLAHGANVNVKEAKNYDVPLTAAIQHLPALVPTLLARGANVNAREGDNVSPLSAAAGNNKPDIVRLLLRRGARVVFPARPVPVHHEPGTPQAVGAIASGRESVNTTQSAIQPASALEEAVKHSPECLEILLQAGADKSPDRRDLLLIAAQCGRIPLFPRLLTIEADPNAVGIMGETPLTVAIAHGVEGIETLLEHGANPNVADESQHTPLVIATMAGNAEAVRLLLAHGASINVRPPHTHTALYYARKKHNAAIIALLQKAGAKDE